MHAQKRLQKTAIAAALLAIAFEAPAQTLEEVVVTAQHREENLQDVPIAITAIGGRSCVRRISVI